MTTSTTAPDTTTTSGPSTTAADQLQSCAQTDSVCTSTTVADEATEQGDGIADTFARLAGVETLNPVEVLNKAAGEMANTAFGDLATDMSLAGQSQILVVGPFRPSVQLAAGLFAFAATATTLLAALITPRARMGARLWWASGGMAKFLLISGFGVTLAVAAVDASNQLTGEAIKYGLADELDTSQANLYSGALASVTVPIVGVMFDFQAWILGLFIVFWPLAAAISITRSFRHALPIMTALIIANVVWPPLSALALAKALSALPNVVAATWWAMVAVGISFFVNVFALAARSKA